MGGLEKILKDIAESAELEATEILNESGKEIAEIKLQGEKDKIALTEKLKIETQEECMKLSSMIEAAAEAEARQIILSAKSHTINEIMEYLKKDIKESAEYFDLLLTLVESNMEEDNGVMYFNKKDTERLPSDFEAKVSDISGGRLTISKEPVAIDSGFVIRYGKIDINCSIDSLFEEKKNILSDIINESLS